MTKETALSLTIDDYYLLRDSIYSHAYTLEHMYGDATHETATDMRARAKRLREIVAALRPLAK